MSPCSYKNVFLPKYQVTIDSNVTLFVQEHVIASPPSPIDSYVTVFVPERVIASPPSPIDSYYVTSFVRRERVIAYPP